MKGQRFDAEILRRRGFKEVAPGEWSKEDSPRSDPTSGADPEPPKDKPKRRKRAQGAPTPDVRTVAIVTVRTVRPRDYDGLGAASKHYLDGLRLCGLFPDDSPDHFECLAVSERVSSFSEEETIIELFQIQVNHTS